MILTILNIDYSEPARLISHTNKLLKKIPSDNFLPPS